MLHLKSEFVEFEIVTNSSLNMFEIQISSNWNGKFKQMMLSCIVADAGAARLFGRALFSYEIYGAVAVDASMIRRAHHL